jgi:integrase
MPRPRKNTERWSHPLYRMGFCLNRKGTVYTEIGGVRTSTGLVWHEKNRKAALQILEKRVLAVLNPEPTLVIEKMLIEAMQEFLAMYVPNLSRSAQFQFRRAFLILLPNNVPLSDIESLRDMLISGLSGYKAQNNTKIGLLKRIHTFFVFCIRQGWMMNNPAKLVVKPKEEKTEINPFTRNEITRMIAYSREIGNVEFSLLLDFLGQTAMRIGETLKLTWAVIDERKIVVDGKGGIEREIPLKPFPHLREVLEELRSINTEKVFRWNTLPRIQEMIRETCEALKIEPRGFHAIRKMRENEWIDSEGVAPHVAAYLCGHSVAVQEKNYRKKPRAAELEKLIGVNQGANSSLFQGNYRN